MNSTSDLKKQMNDIIFPAVSIFCQVLLGLVLLLIKKLQHSNYHKINKMHETILDSVNRVQLSQSASSRQESNNDPYQEIEMPSPVQLAEIALRIPNAK